MKKKGFTLIELLAVIVILAIIALIATPAVLNIIEDSRKSAAEASARNIVSAAKTYSMSQSMKGESVTTIDLSGTTLLYDGEQATKGYITFTDGKPSGKMYISGYCVTINVNGNVTSEKMDEDECEIEVTPSEPEVTTKTYTNGEAVYFNPVTGVKCNAEEVTSSATGTNDTCMKWYAFLDSESSSTVNLLLDHNTTDYVAWNSNSNGTTPDTVLAELNKDITNWNTTVKSTARLISATEVNQIAPTNVNWNISNSITSYNLHTGKTYSNAGGRYEGAAGTNTYAWLFDNTKNCTKYGCNVGTSSDPYAYWTSTYAADGRTWSIACDGQLNNYIVTQTDTTGVRPVITVSKSIFE